MKIYLILSIALITAAITLAAMGFIWGAILCGLLASLLMMRSYKVFRKSQQNIITVLKAVENNDHTFYLKENNGESSNKGFNQTLNQIKHLIQETQKEVRDQELFLSQIIEQVPTGIIIMNEEGSVRFINQSALTYLSLPVITHLHRIRQVYPELYDAIIECPENESKSVVIQTEKEIQQLIVEKSHTSLASEVVTVITINDFNSELEQRETDSWISLIRVMTHEIMNSIAPIRSISEILLSQEQNQNEEIYPAIKTIHDTSDRLIRFVDDYRKFSSVPQPQPSELLLEPLIAESAALIMGDLKAKSIALNIDLSAEVEVISADKNLMMQVLQNLLKNALEATPEGGIIEITSGRTVSKKLFIQIFNSGEPIADDVRPYIFIPFFSTKAGGSGIGLSLSRYIMRLHGGNLRYVSHPKGSSFLLEL